MYFKIFLLIFYVCFIFECSCDYEKIYYKDYIYREDTNSFYKFHAEHKSWLEAGETCSKDGAFLFYPNNKEEARMVMNWWKELTGDSLKRACNYYRGPFLHVGLTDQYREGVFKTVNNEPIELVYHQWAPEEPNNHDMLTGRQEDCVFLNSEGTLTDIACDGINPYWSRLPFLCQITLPSVEAQGWDVKCNMQNINKRYIYDKELDRCYRLHNFPANWTDAAAICEAEDSYLAVINSAAEAGILSRVATTSPIKEGTGLKGAVHLGFHNRDDKGWQTIKGDMLVDTGYSKWGVKQPDGDGREKCGSMFYNGHLNDIGCDVKCSYICEHEVDKKQFELPRKNYDLEYCK